MLISDYKDYLFTSFVLCFSSQWEPKAAYITLFSSILASQEPWEVI